MADCLYGATDCIAAVPLERWNVEGVDAPTDILQVPGMWPAGLLVGRPDLQRLKLPPLHVLPAVQQLRWGWFNPS